ncbi:MAG: ABC transporter ATP-binding protein [Bdellovibrionales bacterium]|nr:ABC transporter ATP-binding protein [Bdellovibrionales bacterium]
MSHIIEVKNLTKSFSDKTVIDNISFELKENQSLVMLGLNGAGKTTTISMLLGLLKPSSGRISVLNHPPGSDAVKSSISCLPQSSTFPAQLKVKEVISFMQSHYASYNTEIVDIFNLKDLLNQPLKNLSGGQKRRVSLACAFVGNPRLVFLDEPTAGVDISQKKVIWKFLKNYQNSGGSLFLTTHDLMEAEVLSQNLLFLHQGQIVEQGTREDLKKKFSLKKVKFKCTNTKITIDQSSYIAGDNSYFEVSTNNEVDFVERLLNHYKSSISDLSIHEMSLMEVVDHIEERK